MTSVEEDVLNAMKAAGKPMKGGDVAEMTGIDKKEVTAALKALKANGKIISPKRCYYAPK